MPQGPIAVQVVPYPALKNSLNINAETVLKASPGTILRISVTTPGQAPGTVNDVKTVGAGNAGNLIYDIPNAVGIYDINFPCIVGILIVPGAGQVLSASYQ